MYKCAADPSLACANNLRPVTGATCFVSSFLMWVGQLSFLSFGDSRCYASSRAKRFLTPYRIVLTLAHPGSKIRIWWEQAATTPEGRNFQGLFRDEPVQCEDGEAETAKPHNQKPRLT